jgi:hypothetical protein
MLIFIGFLTASPTPADFKKTLKRLGERFDRVQAQRVHRRSVQRLIQLRQSLFIDRSEAFAHCAAMRIKFQNLTGLGIFNREQPGVGQTAFTWIVQMQADEIVPRVCNAEFLDDIAPG